MSTTLYPGIAFSPQALLTDNIGASDTIIPVSDVSCFPEGPNLATIGTDETGETIFYAAKTANALSGCQRGVEGEARTWTAGESIGRNFTAKDHNDLINFLGQKQDKLNGKSGQVVGFDAKGQVVPQDPPVPPNVVTVPGGGEIKMPESLGEGPHTFEFTPEDGKEVQASQVGYESTESGLEAPTVQAALDQLSTIKADVGRVSNENLLHNWYLADPTNQRGQTEYTGSRIYCIDRWALHAGKTTFNTKSHTIKTYANTNWCGIYQYIDNSSMFIRKALTFSALLSTDTELWIRIVYGPYETDHFISVIPSGASGCFSVTGVIPQNTTQLGVQIVKKNAGTSDGAIVLEAVKFELGPVQTLAHREGDTWVLNDPPPNKTLELEKCQRYQLELNSNKEAFCEVGIGIAQNTSRCFIAVPTPVTMRAKPAINITGNWVLSEDNPSTIIPITSIFVNSSSSSSIKLDVRVESGLTAYRPYALYSDNDRTASLLLDANL